MDKKAGSGGSSLSSPATEALAWIGTAIAVMMLVRFVTRGIPAILGAVVNIAGTVVERLQDGVSFGVGFLRFGPLEYTAGGIVLIIGLVSMLGRRAGGK